MRVLKVSFFLKFTIFALKWERHEGFIIEPRIISGLPAYSTQFPWQVILTASKNELLRGGGSIISRDWILTAAHCTHNLKHIYITFGTIFLWDKDNQTMKSKQIFEHPDFNSDLLSSDIALIKLPSPLEFSAKIKPISLVSNKNKDFVRERAIISGFGYVGDEQMNILSDLLYANVEIISNDQCTETYKEKLLDTNICSIGIDDSNSSICNGDSGGPLIARDEGGNYIQIGIISFSAKISCTKNFPSVYTRISYFLDFINDTMNTY